MKHTLFGWARKAVVVAGVAVVLIGAAHAQPSLTMNPSSSTIGVGGTATVQLQIAGLAAPGPLSLGSWIVDISYNGGIVSIGAGNVAFGTALGPLSVQFTDLSTVGSVKADETSLVDTAALNAAQPGSFTLASFTFTGVAPGTTTLGFTRLELGDETGLIRIDQRQGFTSSTASITVVGQGRVPDSGTSLGLFGIGLVAMSLARRLVRRRA